MARHTPHIYLVTPWQPQALDVDVTAQRHLEKVLRIGESAPVTYTDGQGRIGEGVYEAGSIWRGTEKRVARGAASLTVAVAPPKTASRVRFIVEKLTELGVERLVWLQTARTEGRPPSAEKAAAWVRAALEQSRGAYALSVEGPVSLAEVDAFGSVLYADKAGRPVGDIGVLDKPVLCVGPEGGFAEQEIPADATRVCVAAQVLRVETAAIAGAVLLLQRSIPKSVATTVGD